MKVSIVKSVRSRQEERRAERAYNEALARTSSPGARDDIILATRRSAS